ncbi:MAG: sigma factor-like helix-turn-helix DNA-binding protein [Kofleriaceae bacterium]
MGTQARRGRAAGVVDAHLERLYNFAYRMTLDARRAGAIVEEIFARTWPRLDEVPADEPAAMVWMLRLATQIAGERIPRGPEVNFDILDETLRNEATRTDVVRSLSDPQRDLLLWDLKQGCMTSVVNCLGPGERAAFVAAQILKLGDDDAAAVLGVSVSAYRVRLSRARQKVGDYLAPRCEHVDPMNPCRCPARVGTALRKGFIAPLAPASVGAVSLRKPPVPYGRYGAGAGADDAPQRDIAAIYGSLPPPELPATLRPAIDAALRIAIP